jgi:hypothetical protein
MSILNSDARSSHTLIPNAAQADQRLTVDDTAGGVQFAAFHADTTQVFWTHEIDSYYTKKAALSGPNAARALLKEKMLRALRAEMRADTGHLATLEEIATILVEEVIRPDVLGDDTARLVKKAAALGRATRKSAGRAAEEPGVVVEDPMESASAEGSI